MISFSLQPRAATRWNVASRIVGARLPVIALLISQLLPPLRAAVPPVEQILPADTLFVFAIPDCTTLGANWRLSPYSQLWNDPAMKTFREKFLSRWKSEFVAPLERDLGVKIEDFSKLPQGQLAFAVIRDDWQGKADAQPGYVLLLDARDKADQLKKLLADLRRKWVEGGKIVQSEKVRDTEFAVVTLTSNDVPKSLKRFFPQHQEVLELGKEPETKSPDDRLFVGQVESLLIVSTSLKAVTKIVSRLSGGDVSPLADDATFAANRLAFFRDAPAYAWFNANPFFDVLAHIAPEKPNPEAPNPVPLPSPDKFVPGTGLGGLKSVVFTLRVAPEGMLCELHLGAPEAGRTGILKLLAAEAKDSDPPAFVPADTLKFWRWRIDGPKAMAALDKMISEVSPQTYNTWNFLISSGEDAAKLDEPTYTMRKDLFGNLGDDLIFYEKAPSGKTPMELKSPPSLLLIGAPNAELLLRALRGALIIRSGDALKPKTREFLGRKVYTIGLPGSSVSGELHYAASGSYVAFSTDVAMLEEYLRSGESQKKPLRETPGLADAAQKVGGQNTGWFGYENRAETMRALFEVLRQAGSAVTNSASQLDVITGAIPFARPEKSAKDWLDYSVLPEYDRVARYFHYTVYSGVANVDGITFKFFWPTPPQARP